MYKKTDSSANRAGRGARKRTRTHTQYTHVCTHKHAHRQRAHVCTQAHTWACTHTQCAHVCTHRNSVHTCAHTEMHMHTHAQSNVHTGARTGTHMHTQTTCTRTHTEAHAHTQCAHRCTRARTRTQTTCTQTHTRARTRTATRTRCCGRNLFPVLAAKQGSSGRGFTLWAPPRPLLHHHRGRGAGEAQRGVAQKPGSDSNSGLPVPNPLSHGPAGQEPTPTALCPGGGLGDPTPTPPGGNDHPKGTGLGVRSWTRAGALGPDGRVSHLRDDEQLRSGKVGRAQGIFWRGDRTERILAS